MTNPPTWPPPPDTPEPLSEYDDFLAACIRNWTPKQPILRLQLAGKLREKTGLDRRSCFAVVNGFCDRHAILVPTHSLIVWSPILLPLVMQTLRGIMNYVLEQRRDAAITHVERIMITAEKRHLDIMIIGIWVMATVASLIWAVFRQKKLHSDAAEAKVKFA